MTAAAAAPAPAPRPAPPAAAAAVVHFNAAGHSHAPMCDTAMDEGSAWAASHGLPAGKLPVNRPFPGRPPNNSSMDGLVSIMAQGAASNRQSDLSAMFAMLQQQEGSAARAAAATERHSNQLAMMAMFSAAMQQK